MNIVFSHWSDVLDGLWVTLQIAVLSYLGALVIGTVLAIMRVSPIAPLRAVGLVYVEFFRNIPLITLLYLIVFGLPEIDILFSLLLSVIIGMACFSGAFVCEAVRTGINTVPLGQAEAARSVGLTFGQSLTTVILPQAFRSMVQPLTNIWIGTLIGSSIAASVGVYELTAQGKQLNNVFAGGLPLFGTIAAIYVVMCLASGAFGSWLERRVRILR